MNSRKLTKKFFNKLSIILVQSEFRSWLVMIFKITGMLTNKPWLIIDIMWPILYDIMKPIYFSTKYSWGVFNGFCSKKAKDANHGVLIAGYTKSKSVLMIYNL